MSEPLRFFTGFPIPPRVKTQAERRQQMIAVSAAVARRSFDAAGQWALPGNPADTRTRQMLCYALLQGDAATQQLGNALIEQMVFTAHIKPRSVQEEQTPFDIFVTNYALQLLVRFKGQLSAAARRKLEDWARAGLNDFPGNRQADYQFHGYNDNMPSKAAFGMVIGGAHFGDAAALAHGLWSLRQLRDMLSRRGLISEFTSPTYSALTIKNLTDLAKFTDNDEARTLANQCVERLWADFLGHFHRGTGMLGGPYTRAYTLDSVGHVSTACYVLWQTFGDKLVWPNPVEEILCEPPRVVWHHAGDLVFNVASYALFTATTYEPPAYLVDWMMQRQYPFHLQATAERGEGDVRGWAAGEVLATSYQEESFALGTSEGDWGGQAEELYLQYRRVAAPHSGGAGKGGRVDEVRVAYPRYLINDQRPGVVGPDESGLFTGEHDYLADQGRYHTVQEGRVALVAVGPHLKLVEQPVTMLRFSLVLPEHLTTVDQVEYRDGHVWVQDGPMYMALRPLGCTNWGRRDAVRIEKLACYRVISFLNYEGPPRQFTTAELQETVNGFVMVVGTAQEGTFEAFQKQVGAAELLDYYAFGMRTVRYRLGKLDLGLCYGTKSNQVRFATINGRMVPRPVWQADGLPAERLPFLSGQAVPNTLEMPFTHINVIWDDKLHWEIFSRGQERGESSH